MAVAVDSGLLSCRRVGGGPAVVFGTEDTAYAVNGTARGAAEDMGWEEVDLIWADDPNLAGTKKNIGLDLQPFLAEAHRALRTGAPLLLEVPRPRPDHRPPRAPRRHRWFRRLKRLIAAAGTLAGRIRPVTEADLRAAVTQAGFTVVGTRPTGASTVLLVTAAATA